MTSRTLQDLRRRDLDSMMPSDIMQAVTAALKDDPATGLDWDQLDVVLVCLEHLKRYPEVPAWRYFDDPIDPQLIADMRWLRDYMEHQISSEEVRMLERIVTHFFNAHPEAQATEQEVGHA